MARKPAPGGKPRQPKGDDLLWLETYFIMFPHDRRPTLAQVEHALAETKGQEIVGPGSEEEGGVPIDWDATMRE